MTETAKRALGLHWQQRTSAEQREFVQLFRDLLERGYLSRIGEYGGEQIKYPSEQIDGDHAIVRALIVTKKGTQVPVESRLLQKADRWLIYDVRRPCPLAPGRLSSRHLCEPSRSGSPEGDDMHWPRCQHEYPLRAKGRKQCATGKFCPEGADAESRV